MRPSPTRTPPTVRACDFVISCAGSIRRMIATVAWSLSHMNITTCPYRMERELPTLHLKVGTSSPACCGDLVALTDQARVSAEDMLTWFSA